MSGAALAAAKMTTDFKNKAAEIEKTKNKGIDSKMATKALQNMAQKQMAQRAVQDRVTARRENRQVNISVGEAGKLAAERALARRRQTSPVLSQRKEVE